MSTEAVGFSVSVADLFEFKEKDARIYSSIGFLLCEFSSLDYEIDDFIFTVARERPQLAKSISKHIPYTYLDKIEFVVTSYVRIPTLREVGDYDGKIDLNWIGYSLEEIYSFRNVFVHGRVCSFDEVKKNNILTVEKFSRASKYEAHVDVFEYSVGFLKTMAIQSKEVRYLIAVGLQMLVDSESTKAKRHSLLRGHAMFREVSSLFADDNAAKFLRAFVPSID